MKACFFTILIAILVLSSNSGLCQDKYLVEKHSVYFSQVNPKSASSSPDTLAPFSSHDYFFSPDKASHLVLSALIVGLSYNILSEQDLIRNNDQRRKASGGIALGIGLGKELYDALSSQGEASMKDVLADLLGISLGIYLFTQ
ncbi:hypothetical protein JW877_10090 [bacterium]|nr:hypothetical protein [bacterium]